MSDRPVAEFGDVGLPDDDGVRGRKAFDDDVVLLRHEVSVGASAAHGPDALGGNQIFDCDGNAGEGSDRSFRRKVLFDLPRRGTSQVGSRGAEGVQTWVEIDLAGQERFDDVDGRYFPLADKPREFDGAQGANIRAPWRRLRCRNGSTVEVVRGTGVVHLVTAHCVIVD